MKWHITIKTVGDVYEFDIECRNPGEAFIPLLRKLDYYDMSQEDVVSITMERQE